MRDACGAAFSMLRGVMHACCVLRDACAGGLRLFFNRFFF
jgi:hypothetical protein